MGTALERRYLNEPDDVTSVFRFFRDQQSEITLRFSDTKDPYSARVVDLEPEKVLLQNIIPNTGAELLARGVPFSISGRADGLFVYISDNKAFSEEADAGAGCYRIPLPHSVLYQQRRKSSRFRLPVKVGVHRSCIELTAQPQCVGRLLDISAGGVRVVIDPAKQDALAIDDHFENCQLLIPNALDIRVSVAVRHTNYNPVGQRLACGLEFVGMSASDRDQLDQFLAQIHPGN